MNQRSEEFFRQFSQMIQRQKFWLKVMLKNQATENTPHHGKTSLQRNPVGTGQAFPEQEFYEISGEASEQRIVELQQSLA